MPQRCQLRDNGLFAFRWFARGETCMTGFDIFAIALVLLVVLYAVRRREDRAQGYN